MIYLEPWSILLHLAGYSFWHSEREHRMETKDNKTNSHASSNLLTSLNTLCFETFTTGVAASV